MVFPSIDIPDLWLFLLHSFIIHSGSYASLGLFIAYIPLNASPSSFFFLCSIYILGWLCSAIGLDFSRFCYQTCSVRIGFDLQVRRIGFSGKSDLNFMFLCLYDFLDSYNFEPLLAYLIWNVLRSFRLADIDPIRFWQALYVPVLMLFCFWYV